MNIAFLSSLNPKDTFIIGREHFIICFTSLVSETM